MTKDTKYRKEQATREALELALEALEIEYRMYEATDPETGAPYNMIQAITAIKEALAQPEPWEKFCDSNCVWTDHHPDCKLAQPEKDIPKIGCVNHDCDKCNAQPKQEPAAWMYPDALCDKACLYLCTKGFTQFPECADRLQPKEPEQEPVAKPYAYEYGRDNGDGTYSVVIEKGDLVQTAPAVYNYVRPRNAHKDWPIKELFDTTPPQRKPLSDEEIILIVAECASSHQHTDIHFARAIERAHGIKGLV